MQEVSLYFLFPNMAADGYLGSIYERNWIINKVSLAAMLGLICQGFIKQFE